MSVQNSNPFSRELPPACAPANPFLQQAACHAPPPAAYQWHELLQNICTLFIQNVQPYTIGQNQLALMATLQNFEFKMLQCNMKLAADLRQPETKQRAAVDQQRVFSLLNEAHTVVGRHALQQLKILDEAIQQVYSNVNVQNIALQLFTAMILQNQQNQMLQNAQFTLSTLHRMRTDFVNLTN